MKTRIFALLCIAALLISMTACGSSASTTTSAEESTAAETDTAAAETETADAAAEEAAPAASEEAAPAEAEDATEDAEEAADAAEIPVELPLADEVTTLTYWIPMPPADSKGVRPDAVSFNDYMLEQTNVQFDFVGPAANVAGETFNIMIASNDYPDFIEKFGNYYTAGYENAIEQEIIVDVSDLIDEYMPHYKAAMTATDDRIISVTTDSGYVPGFASFYQDPADDNDTQTSYGTIIRQDWLDELGLDSPATYDDYYNVLTAFKDAYGATMWLPKTGVVSNNVFISGFDTAGFSNGSTTPFYVGDDGQVHYGPIEDGYYDYLTLMAQWYDEGLIYQDFISGTDVSNADSSLYANGTVGVFFCGNRAYSSLKTSYTDIDFEPARNPVQNVGDAVHLGTAVSSNSVSVVLTTGCDDQELAAKLVDWMYTEDATFHASYGFEGEAYTLDANGTPVFTDLVTENPDGREAVEALASYSTNYFVWNTDPSIEASLQGEIMDQLYAVWGEQDGNDWNYPTAVTMTEDESNEFTASYSDIETYVSEQTLRWICGESELTKEAFESFKQSINTMGLDTCLNAKQTAYDRYCQRGA
jgi:putative aldouronate transport system substrate-binding protein